MANIPTISITAPSVVESQSIWFSNAFVSSLVVLGIIGAVLFVLNRKVSLVPGRLQVAFEAMLNFFYEGLVNAYGDEKRARKYLPLILGLFIFLLIANQFTIIPFVQSIVVDQSGAESVPLFRNPTSHLALPVALALIVLLVSHVIAFTISPLRHIGNFIKLHLFLKVRSFKDFANALLENFLSLLDIVGEVAKVVSLACRLFGNVFAGEVMVAVIAGLSIYTQFIVPIPFYVLSIFSGLIQALVFAILAMAYITGMHTSVEETS